MYTDDDVGLLSVMSEVTNLKRTLLVLAAVFSFAVIVSVTPVVAVECGFENPEWRGGFSQGAIGADVEPEPVCAPDSPQVVGISVLGTNNAPDSLMVDTVMSSTSISKSSPPGVGFEGDYDVVDIELEILTVGEGDGPYGWGRGNERWTYAPKTRGVDVDDTVVRPPSTTLRVENEDLLFVWIENSHRLSHSTVFDGVNVGSSTTPMSADRNTIHPGDAGTYILRPEEPGVYTYYSEQNGIDTRMGLGGMVVIEEEMSDNPLQTFNVGGGKVRAPSLSVTETYEGEYDLVYGERNDGVVEAARSRSDPDAVLKDAAEHDDEPADAILLNGRTYPDTLRESLITVEEGGVYRLNMANTATETLTVRADSNELELSVREYGSNGSGGGYTPVDEVELEPKQGEHVRLEVGEIDGPVSVPLYVEERGVNADDSPTTFIATQEALDDNHMPEEVELKGTGDGPSPPFGSPTVPVAALLGTVVGAVGFFAVGSLRGGDDG